MRLHMILEVCPSIFKQPPLRPELPEIKPMEHPTSTKHNAWLCHIFHATCGDPTRSSSLGFPTPALFDEGAAHPRRCGRWSWAESPGIQRGWEISMWNILGFFTYFPLLCLILGRITPQFVMSAVKCLWGQPLMGSSWEYQLVSMGKTYNLRSNQHMAGPVSSWDRNNCLCGWTYYYHDAELPEITLG